MNYQVEYEKLLKENEELKEELRSHKNGIDISVRMVDDLIEKSNQYLEIIDNLYERVPDAKDGYVINNGKFYEANDDEEIFDVIIHSIADQMEKR